MFNITNLIDDKKCFEEVRNLRWEKHVICPHCGSINIIKDGHHESCEHRQRYKCKDCKKRFDDLTDTVFQNSNISLKIRILCSYFMALNLSNSQISEELDIGYSSKYVYTTTNERVL
jgi:transposase-like protein